MLLLRRDHEIIVFVFFSFFHSSYQTSRQNRPIWAKKEAIQNKWNIADQWKLMHVLYHHESEQDKPGEQTSATFY